MANLDRPQGILGEKFNELRQQCEYHTRNQISSRNELRRLFPGDGDTHQLPHGGLTLEDAVLTIAAVLLGASQIKYPFKIAMGNLDFYRTFPEPNPRSLILPERCDAIICPVAVVNKPPSGKRKRNISGGKSDKPDVKRRMNDSDAARASLLAKNHALAVCEPTDETYEWFGVDLAATREETPAYDRDRVFNLIHSALLAARWQEGESILSGDGVRYTAPPLAHGLYQVHIVILHAWAYILDLPLNPEPERYITEYSDELMDLFNLALRGQMTYELLKQFLKDVGYLYPAESLDDFQCITGKYRAPLQGFRSVEIRKDENEAVDQHAGLRNLDVGASIPLNSIRNAIGSVWRVTQHEEFGDSLENRYSFATRQNVTYGPANAPLILLHNCNISGATRTVLSTVQIPPSQSDSKAPCEEVEIIHFGIGLGQRSGTGVEAATERTVKQCGWHAGDDVTRITFRHEYAESQLPVSDQDSGLFTIFTAWCLLLGLDLRRSPESPSTRPAYQESAQEIVKGALDGTATIKDVKLFLAEYRFTSPLVVRRIRPVDEKFKTAIQPADRDALKEFIEEKRLTQKEPTQPDTPASEKSRRSSVKPPPSKPKTPSPKDKASAVPKTPSPKQKAAAPKTPSPKLKDPFASKSPSSRSKRPRTPSLSQISPKGLLSKSGSATTPSSKQVTTTITAEDGSKKAIEQITVFDDDATPTESPTWSSPRSTRSTPEKAKRRQTPKPTPPATVLPWEDYRNPEKFSLYDTSDCDAANWMVEFRNQLEHCQRICTSRMQGDSEVREARFTVENGAEPRDGAARDIVGELIVSLWKPLWDRTIKFGLVDINHIRSLQDRELSWNGVGAAVGGPYPFIMPIHGTSANQSPLPEDAWKQGQDMGHFWLAVGRIREDSLLDPDGKPTLREATEDHPIHVEVDLYDTQPALVMADRKYGKPGGLIKYSGWAVGAIEGTNNHGQTSLLPRHWKPTIAMRDMPCPNQFADRSTKRVNACGLLTTLHAWMVMLDLPITAKRSEKHKAKDFYRNLIQLFDLALAGALTTRCIQAFVNAFHYIAKEQDLKASVVDAQTEDPQQGAQLLEQLVKDTAFYPYAP